MNILYLLWGIGCCAFGVWDGYKELKFFSKGKQDKLGGDIKMLGADICAIAIGVYLIFKHI